MRDWEAMAKARGLQIPSRELDRVPGPLRALEEVFRPLAADIPPTTVPSTDREWYRSPASTSIVLKMPPKQSPV